MLQEKLNAMKAASAEKLPAETRAVMQQATANLASSGILEQAIKAGDRFPDFELNDAHGKPVQSTQLRQSGPLLISIYRGVW